MEVGSNDWRRNLRMMAMEKSLHVIGSGGGDQDSRDREYRQKSEANSYSPAHTSSFISCTVAMSTRGSLEPGAGRPRAIFRPPSEARLFEEICPASACNVGTSIARLARRQKGETIFIWVFLGAQSPAILGSPISSFSLLFPYADTRTRPVPVRKPL